MNQVRISLHSDKVSLDKHRAYHWHSGVPGIFTLQKTAEEWLTGWLSPGCSELGGNGEHPFPCSPGSLCLPPSSSPASLPCTRQQGQDGRFPLPAMSCLGCRPTPRCTWCCLEFEVVPPDCAATSGEKTARHRTGRQQWMVITGPGGFLSRAFILNV